MIFLYDAHMYGNESNTQINLYPNLLLTFYIILDSVKIVFNFSLHFPNISFRFLSVISFTEKWISGCWTEKTTKQGTRKKFFSLILMINYSQIKNHK